MPKPPVDLDHLAVAAEHVSELWPRYRRDLGGDWVAGGGTAGFYSAQVRFTGGMKIEALHPETVELNDFLRRFLDRNGPGPHHLTFKVADIVGMLATVEAAGWTPVSVDLSMDEWKEAFLHPKATHGIVVQLAQSTDSWEAPQPDDFPTPVLAAPATLVRVTHAVRDLPGALELFEGILAGARQASGDDEAGRWVELAWPGGGCIRLVTPASPAGPLAEWIGDRPGRLHHVAFRLPDPGAVPGAVPLADGTWEVGPDDNRGTRLLLSAC